jgi:transcriptional regulator with XRE-family HTH domain
MRAGELLKAARERRGVSQRELARRARVGWSAITAIEEEHVSPTVTMLEELLLLIDEELILEAGPPDREADLKAIRERLALTDDERLESGLKRAQAMIDEGRRLEQERG